MKILPLSVFVATALVSAAALAQEAKPAATPTAPARSTAPTSANTTAAKPASPAPATPAPAPVYPITVAVTLDKKEYMHGEPGVRYIMAPTGTLKATLTIKNNTNSEHKLTFPSAQSYDFVIRDSAGKEVKRWSAGRSFGEMLQVVTLKSGETKTYTDTVALGGPAKPLPQGSYTIEGEATYTTDEGDPKPLSLPANVNPRVSAKVPFTIIATPP